MTSIERASEGSNAVSFVAFESGTVVIKSGITVLQECFTAILADAIGAKVPRMRVILAESDEFAALLCAVHETASRIMCSVFRKEYTRLPSLSLQTFVVGGGVGDQDSLRDVGALVVLDLLIFNIDRFPLFCEDCNASNLIIDADGRVFGVDQSVKKSDEHLTKLRALTEDYRRSRQHTGWIKTVLNMLKAIGFDLTDDDEAAKRLCDGIDDTCERVRTVSREMLEAFKERVNVRSKTTDEQVILQRMLDDIDIDQLHGALDIICNR